MTRPEGAASHPLLAQAEQVAPHLFLAEQVGRAVVMRSQPTHRLYVDLLRSPSQSGQDHVIDHPRTLWRHGSLLSLMFRWAVSRPPTRKDTPACQLSTPRELRAFLGEAVPSNI
jgi:hypothetical protein